MITTRTRNLTAAALVCALALLGAVAPANAADKKPNILFILADNLGYGELGVYGGGVTRGAPTPRIDSLAKEGMRFLNMNMETQCTPSRSSLMTGRFSIRSGTYAVPFGGVPEGLTQWEVTIAESLSEAGYATALLRQVASRQPRRPVAERPGLRRVVRHPAHDGRVDVVILAGLVAGHRAAGENHGRQEGREERRLEGLRRRAAPAHRRRDHAALGRVHGAAGKGGQAVLRVRVRSRSRTCPRSRTRPSTARPATAIGPTCWPRWTPTSARCSMRWTSSASRDNTIVIFTSDNGAEFVQALGRLVGSVARRVFHRAGRRHPRAVHDPLAGQGSPPGA